MAYYKTFDLNNKPIDAKIGSMLTAEHIKFTGILINEVHTKCWYKNGQFHREDGPALVYDDGYKEYWLNDELIANYVDCSDEQFKLLVDIMKLKKLL